MQVCLSQYLVKVCMVCNQRRLVTIIYRMCYRTQYVMYFFLTQQVDLHCGNEPPLVCN